MDMYLLLCDFIDQTINHEDKRSLQLNQSTIPFSTGLDEFCCCGFGSQLEIQVHCSYHPPQMSITQPPFKAHKYLILQRWIL